MRHDGPAALVLNLRSLGFGISINSDFCLLQLFLFPRTCVFFASFWNAIN